MYIPRDELIDIIVRNNMIEEFASWIKKKLGDDVDPISFHDVDYKLLLDFVIEKKLINIGSEDVVEYIKEAENIQYLDLATDGEELEKKMLPKKIRRKT